MALTDVVVRTVAWAEPSSKVASLTNGHTTQVGANTQHDKPLGLLDTSIVRLGVAESLPVDGAGLLDLGGGTVTDEDGLSSPLDDNVLALGDGSKLDFNLGESENVGRGGHGLQEFGDGGLGGGGGDDTHGSDHEVGKITVSIGVASAVGGEVRGLVGVFQGTGGVHQTLLVVEGGGDYRARHTHSTRLSKSPCRRILTGSEGLGHERRANLGGSSSPSGSSVGAGLDTVAMAVSIMGRSHSEVQKRGIGNAAGEGAGGGGQRDSLFEDLEGGHGGRRAEGLVAATSQWVVVKIKFVPNNTEDFREYPANAGALFQLNFTLHFGLTVY